MPSKRKAKELEEENGVQPAPLRRSTRSTTRAATVSLGTVDSEHASLEYSELQATKLAGRNNLSQREVETQDQSPPRAKRTKKITKSQDISHTTVAKPTQKGKGSSHSMFSQSRALELFSKYRDKGAEEETIGAEGLEQFCQDSLLDMDGPKPLILAWILDAKTLGRFSKTEWDKGTNAWRLDTTEKFTLAVNDVYEVLFSDNIHDIPSASKSSRIKETASYNKTMLQEYRRDPLTAYRKFYSHQFELIRPEQVRSVDMEIATAIWSTILTPRYPICVDIVDFINAKKTYRGVNKDLWSMTLEFCQEFQSASLDLYETEGAWPTLMDDFVIHRRSTSQQA